MLATGNNMTTVPRAGGGGLAHEIQSAIAEMGNLKVTELKSLSRSIGLSLTGRKLNLQERIEAYIKRSMSSGGIDPWRPKTIRALIAKLQNKEDPLPTYSQVWEAIKTGKPIPVSSKPTVITQTNAESLDRSNLNHSRSQPEATPFITSIFYKIIKKLSKTERLLVRNDNRGRQQARFTIDNTDYQNIHNNKNYKLYLFSYERNYRQTTPRQIEFPFLNEISINSHKIKDNVRGIKNKPGTAKPADLTPYLKPNANDTNILDIVYAQTAKDFLTVCYIVEIIPPERLLEGILRRPKISKNDTVRFIKRTLNEENGEDFVTTSIVLSLQCPISYTKMNYPAKSPLCDHIQCFDALWYLHSQAQVPTWLCPVCSKQVLYEQFQISEYVEDIIKVCGDDVEQVEIHRDGSWVPIHEDDSDNENSDPEEFVKKESGQSIHNFRTYSNSKVNEVVAICLDSEEEEEEEIGTSGQALGEELSLNTEEATDLLAISSSLDKTDDNSDHNNNNNDRLSVDSDVPLSELSNNNNNNNKSNENNIPASLPPFITSSSFLGLTGAQSVTVPPTNISTQQMKNPTSSGGEGNVTQSPIGASNNSGIVGKPTTNRLPINPINNFEQTRGPSLLNVVVDRDIGTSSTVPPSPLQNTVNNSSNILGLNGSSPRLDNAIQSNTKTPIDPVRGTEKLIQTPSNVRNSRRVPNGAPISPFIPRKSYPSNLPRKRPFTLVNHPNNIQSNEKFNDDNTNYSNDRTMQELGIEISGNNNYSNEAEIIDLTSDD